MCTFDMRYQHVGIITLFKKMFLLYSILIINLTQKLDIIIQHSNL